MSERAAEWVYKGVWKILSDWFRVPPTPPQLPVDGGSPVRSFHPSLKFLSYLKLWFWIMLVLVDIALLIAWAIVFAVNVVVGLALAPVFLFLIIAPDVVAYVAIHVRYDATWYVMSDRSLRSRRGVWLICEHTVTFENVQDVYVRRGPIQQLFGISTIVVETAGASEGDGENKFTVGNKAILEGIDNPDEIRELIMERVRRSRSAGLGDERHVEGRSWSSDDVAMIREIRDAARALA